MKRSLILLSVLCILAGTALNAKTKFSFDDSTDTKSTFDATTEKKDDAGKGGEKGKKAAKGKAKPATAAVNDVPAWVSNGNAIFQTVPAEIITYKKYVFIIPGEKKKTPEAVFKKILQIIAKRGFVVIANPVPDENAYGNSIGRINEEINLLIRGNVPLRNISVIGIGPQGGKAAFQLASKFNDQDLNVVLVSAIPKKNPESLLPPGGSKSLSGRILNVYDRDDEAYGSCKAFFKTLEGSKSYSDKGIKSGKGNGMPLKAIEFWLRPSLLWIK